MKGTKTKRKERMERKEGTARKDHKETKRIEGPAEKDRVGEMDGEKEAKDALYVSFSSLCLPFHTCHFHSDFMSFRSLHEFH